MILDMDFQQMLADVKTAVGGNSTTAYNAIKAIFNHPEVVRELSYQDKPANYIQSAQDRSW